MYKFFFKILFSSLGHTDVSSILQYLNKSYWRGNNAFYKSVKIWFFLCHSFIFFSSFYIEEHKIFVLHFCLVGFTVHQSYTQTS